MITELNINNDVGQTIFDVGIEHDEIVFHVMLNGELVEFSISTVLFEILNDYDTRELIARMLSVHRKKEKQNV